MSVVDQPRAGFEGSYLGSAGKISERAIMECKICWTPYDPAVGDEYRQVLPGTPFLALPHDWKCPNCDAPKEQFMVLEDPGGDDKRMELLIEERTKALVEDFKDVFATSMRGMPVVNSALHVQAVGFRAYGEDLLGVLISPWFMYLVLIPQDKSRWLDLKSGAKDVLHFPSGSYEFIHAVRDKTGGYKACSLFSPMDDFPSQMQAVEVAKAVMSALFNEENREETDRSEDIRAEREKALAEIPSTTGEETGPQGAAKAQATPELSRRDLLGLSRSEAVE